MAPKILVSRETKKNLVELSGTKIFRRVVTIGTRGTLEKILMHMFLRDFIHVFIIIYLQDSRQCSALKLYFSFEKDIR